MRDVNELFGALGGPAEVGRIIGKSTEHAAAMRRRGSIPVEYWPKLVAAAADRQIAGITPDSLMAMHAETAAGAGTGGSAEDAGAGGSSGAAA